jgi:uncharacterized protein (TIGR02118 family)
MADVILYALYRRPADPAGFLSHYRDIHLPLAAKMPGLVEIRHGPVHQPVLGRDDWFYLARMRFRDQDALTAALASSEGRAAARDLAAFAQGLVELFVVEEA